MYIMVKSNIGCGVLLAGVLLLVATDALLCTPATQRISLLRHTRRLATPNKEYPTVQVNNFFKEPVPAFVLEKVALRDDTRKPKQDFGIVDLLTAPPGVPGVPRPLWLVALGSVPSGLLWYGYYKFAVEEELLALELANGKTPRGFGGFGTLGPFAYGIVLGPIAAIFHLPGGIHWATMAIVFIYYTQFLLYDRVNQLYKDEGMEEPLTVWWCLPIFFPFNVVVGVRQVHFLSQYWYRQRGVENPPSDPISDFFPFVKAPKFTWQQFLTTPSLWCSLLSNHDDIDPATLPYAAQEFLKIDQHKKK
jgi:hypothetical protein